MIPYTVFSHGLGTDTCTMLEIFASSKSIRERFVSPERKVIVIFSDLGNEYPETYAQIPRQIELCEKLGWEWVHLTTDMGFHPCYPFTNIPAKSIVDWWRQAKAIGMTAGDKRCTSRWKVEAIWNYISDRVEKELNITVNTRLNRKAALSAYTKACGDKFELIIGFAMGEESRAEKSKDTKKQRRWMRENVTRLFPLIDMKMDRRACNLYFENLGRVAPRPSNCKYCFYQSAQELLWLYRYHREDWNEWCELEETKMRERGGNGAKGKYPLRHYLAIAEERYGHLSKEQLLKEVQYHGGCGKNAV